MVCSRTIREYLVNTMRPLIFSTALPPFQIAWTSFIWEQLPSFTKERENLLAYSRLLAEALTSKGGEISQSHIIPFIVGESEDCVRKAEELQRKGFYCLLCSGTSRWRKSSGEVDQPARQRIRLGDRLFIILSIYILSIQFIYI